MDEITAPRWLPAPEAGRWPGEVSDWTAAALAGHGLAATGRWVEHTRAPWSVVLALPTSGGTVWFKQSLPALAPEPALLARLADLAPGRFPRPLAAEPGRGWLLLPDLGQTLRHRGRDHDPRLWADVLSQWGQVVRGLAPSAALLTALGVPSLRPAADDLPSRIGQLAALPASDPARLTPADARRLAAVVPAVVRAEEELAGLGLPETLWHNDLHTNNVFAPAGRDLVFFDLGDVLIGSPLADLLIPLRSFAHARGSELAPTGAPLADPVVARVVEAALEPWTDLVPARELRAAIPAALLVATLGRADSWRRAVPPGDADADARYGDASTAWLLELVGGAEG